MADQHTYWNRMVPELTVTDFTASWYFYVDVIGFDVMIRRQDPDFAYLNLGEAQLMIEQYQIDGWNTGALVKPLGRGINLQIEVEDIEPLYNRVKNRCIPLYRELCDHHYSADETEYCQREFLVQDPDGYLLRFSQYIE